MGKYVWLFPILFIFHDMEEVIGFGIFLKKNKKMLDEKYPFISRAYEPFSTEGFALAVFEEFAVCLLFCIIAVATDHIWAWLLWLGGFIAYALHLVLHMGQSLIIKKYIPASATSFVCLPVSVWCIAESIAELHCKAMEILVYSIVGIAVVMLNLKFAHSLIGKFTKWIEK